MINWAIYSLHLKSVNDNKGKVNGNEQEEENTIELCELFIPMGLSLLLCFVHSQIVATSVIPASTSKNRNHKLDYAKKNGLDRIRRKKKLFRYYFVMKYLNICPY